jgi:signal transduction histidine kinase
MRWLPAFELHGREVQFPLCPGTALLLLRAAHASTIADVAVPLSAGLLADPFTCFWLWRHFASGDEVQSVDQLIQLVRPCDLRIRLAAAPGRAVDPSALEWQRARGSAIAAAIQIVQGERSLHRAAGSRFVLDCLLHAAVGYARRFGESWRQPTDPAGAGEAEALARLEEASSAGRRLSRRLVMAWREQPADPNQILAASLEQWRRLAALETHFQQELTAAKLASLKELAYGASHELNNPIANIAARAQVLLKQEQAKDRRRALEVIHQQALRAYQMIADLMLFAKPPALKTERIRVSELVSDVVQHASRDAAARSPDLAVRCRAARSLGWLDADRLQLELALNAICQNAIEAMGDHGTLAVLAAGCRGEGGSPELRLRVRDSGPGIPNEILPHIFDPFFSGREAGRGLGFGLSRAWRIVSEHGGRILAKSRPARGATFTICLPGYLPRQNGCEAA